MKKSTFANLKAMCATIVAFALATLSNYVLTRRASASILTVTSTADSGPGSLRDVIASASPAIPSRLMFHSPR